jgi:hypothetical protein
MAQLGVTATSNNLSIYILIGRPRPTGSPYSTLPKYLEINTFTYARASIYRYTS